MYELTDQQVSMVIAEVESAGINFSHLDTDLIDHICCDIESHMNQGISFDKAFKVVREEFNIKGLRQIQQDTLMLIDKNYRIMKKSMKTIGMFAMSLMAFGALFKIFHWPGASIMLVVSFFFTTLVFFPTLLYVVYKQINKKHLAGIFAVTHVSGTLFMAGVIFKLLHWPHSGLMFISGLLIIAYILLPLIAIIQSKQVAINKGVFLTGIISIMIFITGLIFKVQHWPGANILLILGSITMVFVFIPMFYTYEVVNNKKFRADFVFGIIAFTYFIVFNFLLTINESQWSLKDFHIQKVSFSKNAAFTKQKLNEIKDNSIEIHQIKVQADSIFNYIESLKVVIIERNLKIDKHAASQLNESEVFLYGKNKNVNFLLNSHNINSPLPKLKTQLAVFSKTCETLLTKDNLLTTEISKLLDINDKFSKKHDRMLSWEELNFSNCPPEVALDILSLWQYNIRLCENHVVITVINNSKTI